MADGFVRIEGLAQLERNLQELTPREAQKALGRAARRSVSDLRKEMKNTAPRNPDGPKHPKYGPLWRNIRTSVRFFKRDQEMLAKVGPHQKVAWYARFYEFGTSRQRARPWLRPIWSQNEKEVLNKFKIELTRAIAQFKAK